MSNFGPSSTQTANTAAVTSATQPSFPTTFSALPLANVPQGSAAWTTDQGPVWFDGVAWQSTFLTAKKRNVYVPGITNMQQVMATPPTVAISTTNPLSTGQQYSVSANQKLDLSFCSITGAGNPTVSGTTSPDNGLCSFHCVQANNSTTVGNQNGSNLVRVSVLHYGTAIAIVLKGLTGNITAKVNDQYVSLTPTAVPNNGALNYYSLTFSGSAMRRIDFIVDNVLNSFRFGGFWVAKTDTVQPAHVRGGKRILVMGDSVTSATGAGNQSAGYVQCFAEYMGYDDVWPSGVGGTGMLNAGSSIVYQARVQQDIIAFSPDEVIIQGFYNDGAFTNQAIQGALTQLIQTIISSLPNTRVIVFGGYVPVGIGYQGGNNSLTGTSYVATRAAIAAVVSSFNSSRVLWIDPSTLPFYSTSNLSQLTPAIGALTSSSAGSATSLNINGGLLAGNHYQFGDGSRFRVLSSTGTVATIDNSPNAQASGTQFIQCGTGWLSGNGNSGTPTGVGNADVMITSDGIHPAAPGHFLLGLTLGRVYEAYLDLFP